MTQSSRTRKRNSITERATNTAPEAAREPSFGASRPEPNRVTSTILCVVVALAPLPYGSVDPAPTALWCVLLGAGLAIARPVNFRRPHFWLLFAAGLLIAAYAFVLREQMAEHPLLAPPHPIWLQAADLLGTPLASSASMVRSQPYFALGPPLACMLALLCGFMVGSSGVQARRLLSVFAWAGAAYAVFGIVAFIVDPTRVLWRAKLAYSTVLTSTFINRNTAAVYFGSSALIWFLFLMEAVRRRLPEGRIVWRGALDRLLHGWSTDTLVALIAFCLCIAAMFMTGSRAGTVISLAVMVAMFLVFFRRRLPGHKRLLAAGLAATLVAVVIFQTVGSGVGARFDKQGFDDGGRLHVYRAALRMVADRPWFGTGLGSFQWAFPAYRSSEMSVRRVIDRAHSTPIELAVELGLPLAGTIVLGWLSILAVLVYGIRFGRTRIVPMAALGLASIGILHSCIDFSFQIPGFALPVMAAVGVGLARSVRDVS